MQFQAEILHFLPDPSVPRFFNKPLFSSGNLRFSAPLDPPTTAAMKIIVEIEVGHWTKKNIEAFSEWLSNELDTNNMHGGDNAHLVSVKKKSTTKKKKK